MKTKQYHTIRTIINPIGKSFFIFVYLQIVIKSSLFESRLLLTIGIRRKNAIKNQIITAQRGHRGLDSMVVGFTTTYAISAYHQ